MLRTAYDYQQQVITTGLMQMSAWAYLTLTMIIKVINHYYLDINPTNQTMTGITTHPTTYQTILITFHVVTII